MQYHQRTIPWITIALASLACIASAWAPLADVLQLDRAAVMSGELWRIATGHLTHWSFDHLLWDTTAFCVLGAICEQRRVRYAVVLAASAAAVSLVAIWLHPAMPVYRGLSGVDSALFAVVAYDMIVDSSRQHDRAMTFAVVLVCIGFSAKVIYEITTGTTFFVDSQAAAFTPIPMAHVGGVLAGLAVTSIGRRAAIHLEGATS